MNKQFLAALIITLSVSVSFAAGPAREAPKAKEDPRKEQGRKKTKAMTPAEAAKAIEMERATKEADKGNSARPNRVKEGFAPEGKNAPETIGKHDARGAKQVTGEFNNGRPVTTEDVRDWTKLGGMIEAKLGGDKAATKQIMRELAAVRKRIEGDTNSEEGMNRLYNMIARHLSFKGELDTDGLLREALDVLGGATEANLRICQAAFCTKNCGTRLTAGACRKVALALSAAALVAIPAEAYASFFNNFLDQTKANPNNNSVACTAVLGKEKFTVNVSGLQHEIPDEVTPPTDADEAK